MALRAALSAALVFVLFRELFFLMSRALMLKSERHFDFKEIHEVLHNAQEIFKTFEDIKFDKWLSNII